MINIKSFISLIRPKRRRKNVVRPFDMRKLRRIASKVVLSEETVRENMANLSGDQPWCNFYDFGGGLYTIDSYSHRYLKKANGLHGMALNMASMIPYITRRGTLEGLTVADLASGEGIHSIVFAEGGALVKGYEGRSLYVDRANFVKEAFGIKGVEFFQADIRNLDVEEIGVSEVVIFSGILHHLSQTDFMPMLEKLYELASDAVIIYTHVGCDKSALQFKLRGPVEIDGGYTGYIFREHPENAGEALKQSRMRSSLDNEFSFWSTEDSLVKSLKKVGFKLVLRVYEPSFFVDPTEQFRAMLVCRK